MWKNNAVRVECRKCQLQRPADASQEITRTKVVHRRKSRELGESKKTFGNHEYGDVGQQLGDSPSSMLVDRLKLDAKRGVVVEPN